MPKPESKRDLNALIEATEKNRAEFKKTQQKVETLELAVKALHNSIRESERKRGKRHPNSPVNNL
ncbi:MAG TPA: hypothetical protein VNV43_12920 [Candidatus Acidoferrales bacterium]|jgi:hypothetical protein|nr:hypothetical protein [Candidatus Acidoferrales bacterium]